MGNSRYISREPTPDTKTMYKYVIDYVLFRITETNE